MGGGLFDGPPPKRSDERRRSKKDAVEIQKVDIDSLIKADVDVPTPPMKTIEHKDTGELEDVWVWHPIAMMVYESFTKSGQAIFYEPTDWANIYVMCEVLDRELSPQPIVVQTGEGTSEVKMYTVPVKGATLTAIAKMMTALLATEGDRRRVRIELERAKAADAAAAALPAGVTSLAKRREDLFGT